MWINRVLSQDVQTENATFATVMDINQNTLTASCHTQAIQVPIVNPCGLQSLPSVGDEVLLIPTQDGRYVCMGEPLIPLNCSTDELKLVAKSGAFIHFKANGDVVINAVTISSDGLISGGTLA